MDKRSFHILEFDKIIEKLVALTDSYLGKELSKKLFPKTSPSEIEHLQTETSDAIKFINKYSYISFNSLHDIKTSLKKVDISGILSLGELLKVADVLSLSRTIKRYQTEQNDDTIYLLINEIKCYNHIEDRIKNSILSEEDVADTASDSLFNIRKKIISFQNSIKDKLNHILKSSEYQKFMQEPIITLRNNRYVVPIKQEHKNEFPGIVHDSSSTGSTLFIEPLAVVESNNEIRKLRTKEDLEIERILFELSVEISKISSDLKNNILILSKLDFLFAKAKLSLFYNCTKPLINNANITVLRNARHPLIKPETVVPINFWIGENFKTLVITGPNTGGKTVTLKTAGLLTLMSQSGLHIPADSGTEIAIFDNIFADIGDEQNIEQNLSTFSSHIKNIVRIINNSNSSSLILLDELGAGTDPIEGAALAISILENLRSKGAITIATTHYSQLKLYALSTKEIENASCEFDIDTLQPTYKLLIGIPGKSNAFLISKKLGLSNDIISKAKELLSAENIKFEDILSTIEKNLDISAKEKSAAETIKVELEILKEKLEDKHRKLDNDAEKILKDAKYKARKILLDAKQESSIIMSKLTKLDKQKNYKLNEIFSIKKDLNSKIENLEKDLTKPLIFSNNNDNIIKKLLPGQDVLILDLNKKATILNYPDKNGEVLVQSGFIKINVKSSNLKLLEKQEKNEKVLAQVTLDKPVSTPSSINVRGYNLEEAIFIIDKYIDNVFLAGLNEVTIIHGKGTGVLRNGIWQFLKNHPHVKSYRIGRFGEGELGVTVVELK